MSLHDKNTTDDQISPENGNGMFFLPEGASEQTQQRAMAEMNLDDLCSGIPTEDLQISKDTLQRAIVGMNLDNSQSRVPGNLDIIPASANTQHRVVVGMNLDDLCSGVPSKETSAMKCDADEMRMSTEEEALPLETSKLVDAIPFKLGGPGDSPSAIDLDNLCTGLSPKETETRQIPQYLDNSQITSKKTEEVDDLSELGELDGDGVLSGHKDSEVRSELNESPGDGVRIVKGRRILDSSDEEDMLGVESDATQLFTPWWKKKKQAPKVQIPKRPMKSEYVEAEAEEEDDEFKGLGGADGEGENDDILDMSDGMILKDGEDAGVTEQGQAALEELRKYVANAPNCVGSKWKIRIKKLSMRY